MKRGDMVIVTALVTEADRCGYTLAITAIAYEFGIPTTEVTEFGVLIKSEPMQ